MEVQLPPGLAPPGSGDQTVTLNKAELREGEIVESVSVGATTASTTPGSNVITLTTPDQVQKTIVIENFSDHPPEMQKDILNAILNSDLGIGAGGGQTVATLEIPAAVAPAPVTAVAGAAPVAPVVPVSAAPEDLAAKVEAKDEVVGETQFPPVTVEDFEGPAASAVTTEAN